MFRAKVAASPTLGILKLATRRRYKLRHDPCLFVTSLFISVSMIIMPLEAYVSEMLPWTSPAPFNPPFATFAEFNGTTLATVQALYNRDTLPVGARYVANPERNSYVLRRLVRPLNDSSMTDGSTQCLASFLVGLPGVLFYGPAMNDILCTFAASGGATTSGTCLTVTFLSLPIANECLWLQRGNDLAMTNQSEDFTLTFALTQYPYPWLLWLKFVTRVVSTSVILHCLWFKYYRHYFSVARYLCRHGHQSNLKKKYVWCYHLIAGDPTVILVTNPYVVGGFFLDLCLSPHVIAASVLKLLQIDDITTLLSAALYLFRMVWIAYASLCVTSYGLKKYRKEHMFAEVDPTLMTITIVCYGPFIWLLGGFVPDFLEWWQWLLVCVEPAPLERIEILFVGGVYIVLVACLPLSYGFVAGYLRSGKPRHGALINFTKYASFQYNSLKNRALFTVSHPVRGSDAISGTSYGGLMYALFDWNPRYKAVPTMNLRGADCFLLCYCNDHLASRMRLSLLHALDCNLSDPQLAIRINPRPSQYPANALEITRLASETGSLAEASQIVLSLPRKPSLWCI
ncbi:hypothetical protein SPRG_15480 [Saprolegnia parasitica CBS 223.65]|uniref:Uncharacterized protein n=1 Tax=Saprolegnia parasitica (strain CBS 223.65) TaxID=695850 RepID=A0A067BJE0_SAPPC|nr:hypothetical protein SPRG_15480 [Saprolegnia parasitica CBS 223.65]KDO18273.1 hypothetical protein SPRG_15480 [Saprolegnia parasitica CBS 223.65]|eukprot:XP_012211025.1 hypothetical protein SPRG_15480 [Saprolegnia parasitica CBS 223.65]